MDASPKRNGPASLQGLALARVSTPGSLTSEPAEKSCQWAEEGARRGWQAAEVSRAPELTRRLAGSQGPALLSLGSPGKRQRDGIRTEGREFGCGFRC